MHYSFFFFFSLSLQQRRRTIFDGYRKAKGFRKLTDSYNRWQRCDGHRVVLQHVQRPHDGNQQPAWATAATAAATAGRQHDVSGHHQQHRRGRAHVTVRGLECSPNIANRSYTNDIAITLYVQLCRAKFHHCTPLRVVTSRRVTHEGKDAEFILENRSNDPGLFLTISYVSGYCLHFYYIISC